MTHKNKRLFPKRASLVELSLLGTSQLISLGKKLVQTIIRKGSSCLGPRVISNFGFILASAVVSQFLVIFSPASQLKGFIKSLLIHSLGHVFGLREEYNSSHNPKAR